MKLTMIMAAVVAGYAAPAHADGSVSTFSRSGELLVKLDDDTGRLAKLVGSEHHGTVRCYTPKDHITGIAGAAEVEVTGCFVVIRRDGRLSPPRLDEHGRLWLYHLMPLIDGTLGLAEAGPGISGDAAVQVRIAGPAGNAIGLWIDCAELRGDLRCEENHAMGGKFSWEPRFIVKRGGDVAGANP